MTAVKDMFKDILQEVMECELSDELGYEKSERMSSDECGNKSKNYRNGYSKKTVKTQMGELEIKVPRDRNSEYDVVCFFVSFFTLAFFPYFSESPPS